jgi:type II secretory pathway component GspD/PulD (secretin)
MVILLAVVGLVLGSGSGLAKAASGKTPALISLDVKQMDLQDVLRLIAEKANINIIAGREVAGEVTLRLKNVDLWEALDAVLEASGFTYREEEGIIRVIKAKELGEVKMPLLETKIIFLKFAKAEDVKKAFEHLLSASGTMEVDATSNALIVTDIPKDIENIEKRVAALEEAAREKIEKEEIEKEKIEEVVESLKKRVAELEEAARVPPPVPERKRFQLNYINVEEKKDILEGVLNDIIGEEGEFFLDFLTNSVSVIASSSYIKKVEEYFERADVSLKRIMIKAEFVEVSLTALKELGIKWRWKGAYEEYPLGATFRYPYYARPEPGEEVPEPPAPLSTRRGDPPWGMGIIFGSVEQELRGIIDLLISKRKAELLSSPSIVTLDGEEARIHVGVEYPYKIKSWKEGELFETTEFIDLGATLEVTPRVREEKRVLLDIHPEIKEITERERWEGGPPVVGTRDTRTNIEVEDGKTIVIGGLLRNTETETREGVPLLSRLPIFGSLFTRKEITVEQTDLLVFITPNILPEELEEEDIAEKRKPLGVQMEELYQKGLDHKKLGEYEKARECFEDVVKKSRIFGFSDYLKYAEKELASLEKLEKERIEKERLEKRRLEEERRKQARLERIKKAKLEKERKRQERLEKAQLEEEKREQARLEKERLEKERLEKRRLERERRKQARLERIKKAKLEKERIRQERLEKARLAKERREQARLEKERIRQERIKKAQLERKRKEEERRERIRQARLERQKKRQERIVKKLYQKGLNYKKKEKYEKARECFEDVIKKSQTYGFSDYLEYAEKELADLEKLEEKGLPDEKTELERFERM